jgi:lysophospholipase L1-like esterase
VGRRLPGINDFSDNGQFNGDSTFGEPGDGVHPNRAGHAAMARCIFNAFT